MRQLVAPQRSVHLVFSFWAALVNPRENLIPGKTGVSVIIDSATWTGPFLTQLVQYRNPHTCHSGGQQLRRKGCLVIQVDIVDDPRFDCIDKSFWVGFEAVAQEPGELPFAFLAAGRVMVLSVLDDHRINGFPNFWPSNQEKVRFGNVTMRVICRIIQACIENCASCFLENPGAQ